MNHKKNEEALFEKFNFENIKFEGVSFSYSNIKKKNFE